MTPAEINNEFDAAGTNKSEFTEKIDKIITWEAFVKPDSEKLTSTKALQSSV